MPCNSWWLPLIKASCFNCQGKATSKKTYAKCITCRYMYMCSVQLKNLFFQWKRVVDNQIQRTLNSGMGIYKMLKSRNEKLKMHIIKSTLIIYTPSLSNLHISSWNCSYDQSTVIDPPVANLKTTIKYRNITKMDSVHAKCITPVHATWDNLMVVVIWCHGILHKNEQQHQTITRLCQHLSMPNFLPDCYWATDLDFVFHKHSY